MSEPIRPDRDGRFQQACLELTRSQVKAIVETYLALEERRGKLTAVVALETGTAPGVVSLFQNLSEELCPTLTSLRRTCGAYSSVSPASRWVSDLPPLGPVVAAGLAAAFIGSQINDADHLHRLCRLHPAYQEVPAPLAVRLYSRYFQSAESVSREQLKPLGAATGRALRHVWRSSSVIPREEVLEWLSQPASSEFVDRLMRRVGRAFSRQSVNFDNRFSRAYQMRLAQEKHLNETDSYVSKAQQEAKRGTGRHQADLDTYRHGKLPLWQLEEMARRWVLRQFLTEYHQRLQTSGSLGMLPPDEC